MKQSFQHLSSKIMGIGGIIFFIFSFLILLFFRFQPTAIHSAYLLTVGRTHPLILHFPLALVAILLFVEIGQKIFKAKLPRLLITLLYFLTLASCLFSLISGYLLWSSGQYSGTLPDRHYNGALFTYAFLIMAYLLFFFEARAKIFEILKPVCLFLASFFVFYTGHLGGSMTHGSNFLTEYMPLIQQAEHSPIQSDSISYLYEDVVFPILEVKCAGCHSTLRAKGGFSVAGLQDLFKKGESGKFAVVHSFPDSSELFKRLILPDTLAEHMPPKGKTPLERKEIEIIKFWIEQGAKAKLLLTSLPDSINNTLISQLAANLKVYNFSIRKAQLTAIQVNEELETLAHDLELTIKRDSASAGNLYMLSNQFPPTSFDTKKLLALRPYFQYFSKISLASTSIDDADLYYFSDLQNVRELYLQKTKIKGQGLTYLKALPNLEILNISFTGADDQFLIDLLDYPALKEVYLYGTKTSYPVIQAIEKNKKGLKIYTEEGPYF